VRRSRRAQGSEAFADRLDAPCGAAAARSAVPAGIC